MIERRTMASAERYDAFALMRRFAPMRQRSAKR
jgi:hypothetical protein